MTKLPERDDGGIDWDAIRYGYDDRIWWPSLGDVGGVLPWEFVQLAVAQTIERCAKVANNAAYTSDCTREAIHIRDTIRKLEV